MVVAWFKRPIPLREQIRQAGIKLFQTGYNQDSKKGFYTVGPYDAQKLRQWLYDSGFKGDTSVEQDDFSFGFIREHKIFFFIQDNQEVTLGDHSQIDKSAPIEFTIFSDR